MRSTDKTIFKPASHMARFRPFRLLRYFSLISLFSIIIASLLLGTWFRNLAENDLVHNEERSNIALAQVLAKAVWPEFSDFLSNAHKLNVEEIRNHPKTKKLALILEKYTQGLDVIKILIYDTNGFTSFSSDFSQIGDTDHGGESYTTAKHGRVASNLAFEDKVYAGKVWIKNRNIISSYIPITKPDGQIEGVFELYTDVTRLVNGIKSTQRKIIAGVIVILGTLFIVLFFVVKRADNIINQQSLEQEKHTARVQHQALHDSLTGLPNRLLFLDRLEHAMLLTKQKNQLLALLFIDLDRFKQINDSLGHETGDQLLIQVTKRLSNSIRPGDTLCRLAGDEFVVILENLKMVNISTTIAKRITNTLSRPFTLGNEEVAVTSSTGIALYPFQDDTMQSLIKKADAAMYYAKHHGRNNFQYYSPHMEKKDQSQHHLERDLRSALEKEQLCLYYQPKINLKNWTLHGVESLLRWNHPTHGIIQPNEFIPILDETGLINKVGEWVLYETCRTAKQWQDTGLPPIMSAVNVSNLQLKSHDFADTLQRILKETRLDPQCLEIELTESYLIDYERESLALLRKLKDIGVKITIDDFGTGYSALTNLCKLPIDTLKIDKSFVQNMITSREIRAIITAIISFAHGLKLNVMAEGVETVQQLTFLNAMHCTSVQGYLISHPLPEQEFERFYRSGGTFEHLLHEIKGRLNEDIEKNGKPSEASR